jgi:hypothetical protein
MHDCFAGSDRAKAAMDAKAITPILNVSSFSESFSWVEKIGWKKQWDWG